ncbi:MAG: NADH-quinone oxidoreductase subunit NuoH [Candidatus Aquicultorales bacterium]
MEFLTPVAWSAGLFGFAALSTFFLVWLERKISAVIHGRVGPMHHGFQGWWQPVADVAKLLFKEDIVPAKADKWTFLVAPLVVFVPAFLSFLVVPIGKGLIARDMGVGLVYYLAVPSLAVVGIIAGGWSSSNKFASIGGLRSAAQLISYEIPRSLSVLGVVMLAGTLSTAAIVESQARVWFLPLQIIGFFVYIVATVAEVGRVPFDLPEAESELVNGYYTEYSGLRWALFMLGEYIGLLAGCIMGAVLFLGGWQAPYGFLPQLGPVWLLAKAYLLVSLAMWIRWTLPRYRIDQLLEISWKVLLPLSLVNVAVTAVIIFAGGEWLKGLLG